jgi:aspartyl-tRNA(Asn)/glutamyl-tRNA(Gln) amidotransferase subunit C
MAEPIEDLIRRTAALARLDLDDEELAALTPQFARILAAFRHLSEFRADEDPDEAGPGTALPPDRARADEPQPALDPALLMDGAPRPVDGFYAVPRTVGGDA